MEWLALLLLVAFIGIGGVLRAMLTVIIGLMVLIGGVVWLVRTDYSQWLLYSAGLAAYLGCFWALNVWHNRRRAKRGLPPVPFA